MTTHRSLDEPTAGLTAEAQEGVVTPADRPVAAFEYGTTVKEQIDGEPHDLKVSRELRDDTLETIEAIESGGPDSATDSELGAQAGRIVELDEGARTDDEKDAVARDAGADDESFSSEELAMHVVAEDDAGLTDDPDGYVTDDGPTD